MVIVGNKVRAPSDRDFLISSLPDQEFLGFIPYDQAIVDADLANKSLFDASSVVTDEVTNIYQKLVSVKENAGFK
jgi:CO dehydrogenase maturation factor